MAPGHQMLLDWLSNVAFWCAFIRDFTVNQLYIHNNVLFQLHETYSKICKRQSVSAVGQSEFISMCGLLEARGIFGIKKAKEMRSSKVTLKLDEGELETALQDKVLVANILQSGLP